MSPACTMQFFKIASGLNMAVFWSFMVACPTASVLRPNFSGALSRSDYENATRSSISNDCEPVLRRSGSHFGSLDKRNKGQDLKLVSFEPGHLLMPILEAAKRLEEFYSGIFIKSQGEWADNTPRIWIRIIFGSIGLVMTATEGTTIPWEFVTWFALEMVKLTERGYTGTYTANFVHPTRGNAIWVSLYECVIGPLTDMAAVTAPAKVVSCLNPQAQAWFPWRGTPPP